MTTHTPPVDTFSETSALYALMEDDEAGAIRICTEMTRTERSEFADRLLKLREILHDLNADRCVHCGQVIARSTHSNMIWWHTPTGASACADNTTLAEPTPWEN